MIRLYEFHKETKENLMGIFEILRKRGFEVYPHLLEDRLSINLLSSSSPDINFEMKLYKEEDGVYTYEIISKKIEDFNSLAKIFA